MGADAVDLQYFGDMPGIPSYESEKRDFDDSPAHSEKAGPGFTRDVLGATDLAAYDADKAEVDQIRAKRPDLTTLGDTELRARLVSFGDLLTRLFQHHIEASLKAGVGLGAMGQFTAAIGRRSFAHPRQRHRRRRFDGTVDRDVHAQPRRAAARRGRAVRPGPDRALRTGSRRATPPRWSRS